MRLSRLWVLLGFALLATCSLDFEQFSFDNSLPPATTTGTGGSAASTGVGGVVFNDCETPADCGQSTTCATPTCTAGMCGNDYARAGTRCTEAGGVMCNGFGSCVQCLQPSDCPGGQECVMQQCVGFSCSDMQMNGDESDVDCGGSCPPCADGAMCNGAADCASGFCDAGTCAPCVDHPDCGLTQYCDNGVCAAQKADGTACVDGAECTSGNCADAVCCDTACSGLCEACTAALSGGTDGVCSFIPLGQDPQTECTAPEYCQGDGSCGTCGQATPPVGGSCPGVCDSCVNDVCIIQCNGSQECQGDLINCPAGFACEVVCSGLQSCRFGMINCPADHACTIDCSGEQGCRQTLINCSAQGPCDVSCGNASGSCQQATVSCGQNACSATCAGGSMPTVSCGQSCSCTTC